MIKDVQPCTEVPTTRYFIKKNRAIITLNVALKMPIIPKDFNGKELKFKTLSNVVDISFESL